MPSVRIRMTLLATAAAALASASIAQGQSLPLVAVDPGHGGGDSGAVGLLPPEAVTELPLRINARLQPVLFEKDVNLDVANRLNAWLVARGFPTLMTRTGDFAGGDLPYTTVSADLKARTDLANSRGAQIFVSIHHNSATSAAATGIETYVRVKAPEPAQVLAAGVQRTLIACLGLRDRGVKERDFYVVRNTTMPALLVEGGFLSNATDVALLAQPDFRQKMAEAIGGSVYQYSTGADPGPICAGVGAVPPPVPTKMILSRAGRALTKKAGINPRRGDLWIATVRDQRDAGMSSVPLRARLPNGKGVAVTTRPDGKALIAVPRRKGTLVVAGARPGVKVAARGAVPAGAARR
jgi:N-acetylmuramoyl-L-alanine amidase